MIGFSEMTKSQAVIFDNDPASVSRHLKILKAAGFDEALLATNIMEFHEIMLKARFERVIYVDMDIPGLDDFGAIGLPSFKVSSVRAGMAVVDGYIEKVNLGPVPAHILTAYSPEKEDRQRLEVLRERGRNIDIFKKDKIDSFEDNVIMYSKYMNNRKSMREKYIHEILIAENMLCELSSNNINEIAMIFGANVDNIDQFNDWKNNQIRYLDNGTHQTANLIIDICEGLSRLLGDDPQRQRKWLMAPQDIFSGRSPWDKMSSPNKIELAQVSGFVSRLVG